MTHPIYTSLNSNMIQFSNGGPSIARRRFRRYGHAVQGFRDRYPSEDALRAHDPAPGEDRMLLDQVAFVGYGRFRDGLFQGTERDLLLRLLRAVGGNKSELARRLGLDRANLQRKIRSLGDLR